jgi:Fe-Mn family superoxide dismutase
MGIHKLPPLPYAYDAIEPYIDAKTMEIHYTKHHQTYVDKLNAALDQLADNDLKNMSVEDLMRNFGKVPEDSRTPIRNHGGGHANHSLWWTILKSDGGGEPSGALAKAIDDTFGNFKEFQGKFNAVAANHFGSGWAWLVIVGKRLVLYSLPNQDSPLIGGDTPVMGLDVWEHAYYLKYQNRRPEYIEAYWNAINWDEVGRRYDEAMKRA